MKLKIPGLSVEVVVTPVPKPPAARWKSTVRGLLLLVMISALCMWCGIWVFDRYARAPITKTYYVGDLLDSDGAQVATELPRFAERLESSAPRDIWSSRNRSV